MKYNIMLTLTAFSIALAATFITHAKTSAFAVGYGDNPALAGTCNPGTMPDGCVTTPTPYGFCTVTFTNGATDDARVIGCTRFYYRSN